MQEPATFDWVEGSDNGLHDENPNCYQVRTITMFLGTLYAYFISTGSNHKLAY